MNTLRLTASLAVALAAPFMPGIVFSQTVTQNQVANPVGVGQTTPSSSINNVPVNDIPASVNARPVGTNPFSNTTPGTNLQTPGANLQTPGTNLQTPGANLQTPGATQTINGQTVQVSPVTTTGTAGGNQTLNGQPLSVSPTAVPTTIQTPANGQAIGPSLPSSTKVPGAEQTFVNGQSVGTTQVAPPATAGTTQTLNNGQLNNGQFNNGQFNNGQGLNGQGIGNQTNPVGVNGSQSGSNTVLYPPQFIPGSSVQGGGVQGNGIQSNGIQGGGVQGNGIQGGGVVPQAGGSSAPVRSPAGIPTTVQPQSTQPRVTQQQTIRSTGAATPNTTNAVNQAAPLSTTQGQGTLDAALQQATCAQDWQRAIRVVNTAIAAAPKDQSTYRAQLTSYRSRLQNLQSKGVRAPNWAQQCRGGNLAINGQ